MSIEMKNDANKMMDGSKTAEKLVVANAWGVQQVESMSPARSLVLKTIQHHANQRADGSSWGY